MASSGSGASGRMPDPEEARFIGQYTTQPIEVQHKFSDGGKTAAYFGRWVTRTGRAGPWSLPVWMQVAVGGGGAKDARGKPRRARSGESDEAPMRLAA